MIELRDLTIRSGPFTLASVNLNIPAGTYAVLMGQTGQGKTTILEAICGLRSVTAGQIVLDGRDVTRFKPGDRNLGYLPQDLALFPTMTVRAHLEFALRVRRCGTREMHERIDELAAALQIGSLLDRDTQHLSGGEAQRVALGRALSFRPRVLLLDEPLNALDEATHAGLCELLRSLQKQYGLTTLHVTHRRTEARALGDKLFMLQAGHIEERPLQHIDYVHALPDAGAAASEGDRS